MRHCDRQSTRLSVWPQFQVEWSVFLSLAYDIQNASDSKIHVNNINYSLSCQYYNPVK